MLQDTETGEDIPVYVIEETTLNEKKYLLVATFDPNTEETNEDAEAFILCEKSDDDEDIYYESVSDEKELSILADIFKELLEDTDFLM